MKTYGELLTALIAHYEWCVENLPKEFIARENFLFRYRIDDGICRCAYFKYRKDIFESLFIDTFTYNNAYLCQKPKLKTFIIVKQALQTRIDRMKEVYDEWKDVEIGV